jgi:hypothetical protein
MEPPPACAQGWARSLAPTGRTLRFLADGIHTDALAMVLAW